jgi:hypothetical protein
VPFLRFGRRRIGRRRLLRSSLAADAKDGPNALPHCAADRVQALADSMDALLNAVADVLADSLKTLPNSLEALVEWRQGRGPWRPR